MTKVGSLRASDADREAIVSQLHKAATEGRIGSDELEQRVDTALKARTYAELDATVADLPRQLGQRPRPPSRRRTPGGWALQTVRANPLLLVLALPVLAGVAAIVLAATITWFVLMIVVMIVGGGRRPPRGPWMYTRRGHGYYGPPRRRARSYWA